MHTFVSITTTVACVCHKVTIILLFCPFHSDDLFCALLPEVKTKIFGFFFRAGTSSTQGQNSSLPRFCQFYQRPRVNGKKTTKANDQAAISPCIPRRLEQGHKPEYQAFLKG